VVDTLIEPGDELVVAKNWDLYCRMLIQLREWWDISISFDMASYTYELASLFALNIRGHKLNKLGNFLADELSGRKGRLQIDGVAKTPAPSLSNDSKYRPHLIHAHWAQIYFVIPDRDTRRSKI
jgi:hypothetical protein